ncbi:MAG: hypothetical protein ABWZ75_02375 [Novosphingobium sp.]
MPRLPIVAFAFGAAVFIGSAPVMAQDAGEKVNQIIVFGDDPCPVAAEGEITVCARKDESERFRIPEPLRETPSVRNDAWSNRVVAYETVGSAGTLSCSPVGAGGSTGCTQKLIDAAFAERRGASDVRFSQLIQEEREKRLATIDAEAADTQKRVEEIEKQYDERERARQDAQGGTAPAATAPAAPSPGTATPAPVVAPAARP